MTKRHGRSFAPWREWIAPGSRSGRVARMLGVLLAAQMLQATVASTAEAGDRAPFTAATGVSLTEAAAHSWAFDAYLIYIENDEELIPGGTAGRWGYVFYSPYLDKSRVYTVREGKIIQAGDLGLRFDAPPIEGSWVDSSTALVAAEEKAGLKYRTETGGIPATMLLMRGAFDDTRPDRVNWLVVYRSETSPSLFVVVNAENGEVTRTWKG